jgi:hypothetical protein
MHVGPSGKRIGSPEKMLNEITASKKSDALHVHCEPESIRMLSMNSSHRPWQARFPNHTVNLHWSVDGEGGVHAADHHPVLPEKE